MKKRRVRSALTLIELLIVIALIGIIGSALAYNLGAGLNKGKEFRTEQGKRKIRNILEYEVFNNNRDPEEVVADWEACVLQSKLVDQDQKAKDLLQDGFGKPYEVTYDREHDQFIVRSARDANR